MADHYQCSVSEFLSRWTSHEITELQALHKIRAAEAEQNKRKRR